jgi:hypothetical protein
MNAIDPAAVKAGDTVTAYIVPGDAPSFTVTGETHATGRGVQIGNWPIADSHVTLTAHQPAPKPEWKPGTSGTATVRGQKDTRVMRVIDARHPEGVAWSSAIWIDGWLMHGDEDVTDFVPDEPRALPTVDEMVGALEFAGDDGVHVREHAEAMLQYLRGESR